jgi:hypothetical protein
MGVRYWNVMGTQGVEMIGGRVLTNQGLLSKR